MINLDITLNSDISVDLKQQKISLPSLAVTVQDLMLNGNINVSKLFSDTPNVAGNLSINPFNLRQLANRLAIKLPIMADDNTLELVQLSTQFTGSTKHFNAKKFNLTLDQSKLSGQFSIPDFSDPAYNFKLILDEIDADRYLPPVSKNKNIAAPPAATVTAEASPLPLETLRQINANGTIDITKLKISGMTSEKIHLEIHAGKGVIKLNPVSAHLYQGVYQGNVNLDARSKTLKLAINEKLKGVQVGLLLKDLTGDDKLSGKADIHLKLTGKGATVDQIITTLSGLGQFSFKDGAIKGINVASSIRKSKSGSERTNSSTI